MQVFVMSGTFGGGFGGDFDDLLPSRSPAPPNIGNPFEDPFADIGRAQESDPWASYDHTKPNPPVVTQTHDTIYEAPPVESHTDPANDFGYKPSSPSPIYEPPVNTYSASLVAQPEPTTPVIPADPAVLEYRAPTPPLSGPLATFPDPSPPTPPPPAPAPAARPPVVPISPSKAGLFDEPSPSTFGSGFVRRHKTQRSSMSSATGQPSAEGRTGSLFSSAKADPLEALVSKARSVSIARTTPPVTPKPEPAPEIKPRSGEKAVDLLVTTAESPTAAEVIGHDTATIPEIETLATSTPPIVPVAPTTDDESTPKESPALLESQTPARSATPTADAPVLEPSTPPAAFQPEETPSAPTPPSRAASESHISQYPEGSAFLQPPQDSPGPGAYARVVSPLDTPATSSRNLSQSFSGLALGGEVPNLGWGGQAPPPPHAALTPTTRSAGWGPVDSADDWGGETAQTGWGGENEGTFVGQSVTSHPGQSGEAEGSASGHSRKPSDSNESDGTGKDAEGSRSGTPQGGPVPAGSTFTITVGDPQKVGDPINPYIVYTVSTKTTSPLYRKPNFSVLRRYSDFLWLFEILSLNKPGVFIPPIPEKQGFGRFQGAFVEARRLALNNCIQKIANHPILSTDDDFKFFIESDSFALDVKHRKAEIAQEKTGGFLSSITGPKFYETDEWFDTKRSYIDALESQLRGLAKSVETVSKHRTELANSTAEFAEAVVILASSDLSRQLSQSLAALADVNKKARKLEEDQSQDDIILLMGIVEEYIRLIGSIRLTFTSRIRLHAAWQNANAEAKRVRTVHEKARRQGKIPQDRVGVAMHEMAEAEKRAADAKHEFDQCSRLIKAEMARFEKERIDDFKKNLEELLESMIRRQQDLIESLENYQEGLLRRSKSIIGQAPAEEPEPQLAPAPH
ncbi:Vacuolar protein sorting-associated protein 5 [Ceratobasidium sp. 414]|nr:Vacuolar protein sorting-associated protein 5 [Ceratobasidium sp. 414]